MKKFVELLNETRAETSPIRTMADLKKAIDSFDSVPKGKQKSRAKEIAEFAKNNEYALKKKSILDLLPKENSLSLEKQQKNLYRETQKEIAKEIGFDSHESIRINREGFSVQTDSGSPKYDVSFDGSKYEINMSSGNLSSMKDIKDFKQINKLVEALETKKDLGKKILKIVEKHTNELKRIHGY
jgi:hypothetical protein